MATINPRSLENLIDGAAPDNPGETVPTTVRLRADQKEWLEAREESNGVLARLAFDLLIAKFEAGSCQGAEAPL